MSPTPPPTEPRPRRRLWLKILLFFVLLAIATVVAIPWLLSTRLARGKIEAQLGDLLHTRVQIENLDLGWLSGFELGGLTIDNPPGFDPQVKALKLRAMKGGFSWSKLLSGRFLLQGKVDGLELRVQQKKDGSSNFGTIAGIEVKTETKTETETDPPSTESSPPDLSQLDRVRIDIEAVDAKIDIEHEEQGLIESLRDLDVKLFKDFGGTDVRLNLTAELHRPDGSPPGKLGLDIDADAALNRPARLRYDLVSLDFARYRPLLAAFLPADQITAFAGVMGGTGQALFDVKKKELKLEGNLNIAKPHFAGLLFQGMNIASDHWVLSPNLEVTLGEGGKPPIVKADELRVDLGFFKLAGLPATEASSLASGKPALGVTFDVDLGQVLRFGGPIPALIEKGAGRASGKFAFAVTEDSIKPAVLQQRFSEFIHAAFDVKIDQLTVQGHEFSGLTASLGLAAGKARVDAGAALGGGPVTLGLELDPTKLDTLPANLSFAWKGGSASPASTKLLRYAVPLLAGLSADGAGVDLQSKVDCDVKFAGPLLPTTFGSTLTWLNQWTGGGKLGLLEGSFAPAGALAPLLQLTGDTGRLAFTDLQTDFTVKDGAVETGLMKLSKKAGSIGLRGKTKLDGTMDWTMDVAEMLQAHKDGAKVLELLGGTVPTASLTGTVDQPQLAAPDFDQLFQQALKRGLEKQVDKAAGDLLRKGFDGLIKKNK